MGRVFVAGSINMDVVATAERHPQVGETVAGTAVLYFPGGKGANQAVAAAKLGAPATLIGRLGLDAFGQQIHQRVLLTVMLVIKQMELIERGSRDLPMVLLVHVAQRHGIHQHLIQHLDALAANVLVQSDTHRNYGAKCLYFRSTLALHTLSASPIGNFTMVPYG